VHKMARSQVVLMIVLMKIVFCVVVRPNNIPLFAAIW
jgi:hypothetical protein